VRHNNVLLPVLQTIVPEMPWPDTLRDEDVLTVRTHTVQLVDETRALAVQAENDLAATGQTVEPQLATDVRMMRWAARAGTEAGSVMRTAQILPYGRDEDALLGAVTAGLMLRGAEFDLGRSQEQHGKSVLNRALGAAEWVMASQLAVPDTSADASAIVRRLLPPGWWWQSGPTNHEDGTWQFGVARTRDGETEQVLVNGPRGEQQPVTALHERLARSATPTEMTWFEACQFFARCFTNPSAQEEGN
jgi:hypothetical protein